MFTYWKQLFAGALALIGFVFGIIAGPSSSLFIIGALACILSVTAAFPLSPFVPVLRHKHPVLTVLGFVAAGILQLVALYYGLTALWATCCFIVLSSVFAAMVYDVRKDQLILASHR